MRTVVPEELDSLGPDDPSAIRSRRDLRRLHRAMGTCSVLTRELSAALGHRADSPAPLRVLELGAGDASLMLRVARSLAPRWPNVQLTLLDRIDLLEAETRAGYESMGWTATPKVMDVLDWARDQRAHEAPLRDQAPAWDLIVANLFLHHFETDELRGLLSAIAGCTTAFVACEPRRSRFALAASRCVGVLGAGSVTRADAVTSVRAGFCELELTALWPHGNTGWTLSERAAGGFSHCLRAVRASPAREG